MLAKWLAYIRRVHFFGPNENAPLFELPDPKPNGLGAAPLGLPNDGAAGGPPVGALALGCEFPAAANGELF